MKKLIWAFWGLVFLLVTFLVITLALKNNDLVEINYYFGIQHQVCLLYTSPSPRDQRGSRMPSSA